MLCPRWLPVDDIERSSPEGGTRHQCIMNGNGAKSRRWRNNDKTPEDKGERFTRPSCRVVFSKIGVPELSIVPR